MNRRTSTLLSIGVSAALVAAAIWLLLRLSAGVWMGDGHGGIGHHHLMGSGMGLVRFIFWMVLIGAITLLAAGAITGMRAARQQSDEARKPLELRQERLARGEIDTAEHDANLSSFNPMRGAQ